MAQTPVLIAGAGSGGQRLYAVSQQIAGTPSGVECNVTPSAEPAGQADGILTSSNTVSSKLPLGKCPVYAVESSDGRRLYVLNRGDDTITVINSQDDTLDNQCPTGCKNQAGATYYTHPLLPLSQAALALPGVVPPSLSLIHICPNKEVCLQHDIDGHKGQDEQQHQLRLPVELRLRRWAYLIHCSIVSPGRCSEGRGFPLISQRTRNEWGTVDLRRGRFWRDSSA